jgi:drug/metabolite transporter (DMT)-like permease
MSPNSRNLLSIHAAVLLFGFAGLFGDKRVLPLSSVVIVFGRVVFASAALLLASLVQKNILRSLSRRSVCAFALLGILLAAHWTTFFQSVKDAGVALALITYTTFPVFVAFLEPLFFRERLHAVDVLRAAVALVGIVILQPRFELNDRATQGILWGIASGATFALLTLLNRRFVRDHSSMTIALYQDLFAAAVLLPFVFTGGQSITIYDLLLLAVLGVLCTAVAHSLFIAGMHGVSARAASMIACLEPVYGALLAVLFLGDSLPLRTALGGIVVLGVAFHATVKPRV